MKALAKYLLAATLLIAPLKLSGQTPEVTLQPKHPKEFWENKEGFEFKNRNYIYKISEGKEILYTKEKINNIKCLIKITEKNHYGNVEEVEINANKDYFFFKGKNEKGFLKYKFLVEENNETSPERAMNLFLKYDEEFRKFKHENNLP